MTTKTQQPIIWCAASTFSCFAGRKPTHHPRGCSRRNVHSGPVSSRQRHTNVQ